MGPLLLEAVLVIGTMQELKPNLEEKKRPNNLKDGFFFENRSIHFHISSTRVKTGQTKEVDFFQLWNQAQTTVFHRLDSRSESNSNCYHKSDARSHLD